MTFAQLPEPTALGTWRIAAGDAGTEATVAIMQGMALDGARAPAVVRVGRALARNGGIEAVRAWLAAHVRFEFDPPPYLETLKTPTRMMLEALTWGASSGDCDDIATLGAALGLAGGYVARFVTIATRPGGVYSHVYTELARTPRGPWHELDTSRELQNIPADFKPSRLGRWAILYPGE